MPLALANPETLRDNFYRDGYVCVPGLLSSDHVQSFVAQVETELARSADALPERAVGPVQLSEPKTWPTGGQRRVVEVVPPAVGVHWEGLLSSGPLSTTLDAVLGQGQWCLPTNTATSEAFAGLDAAEPKPVRNWYCPITFPERWDGADPHAPVGSVRELACVGDICESSADCRESCLGTRPVLLLSGPEDDGSRGWQPVNRRRVRGKGWHIDPVPGHPEDQPLSQYGEEGAVILLLLSDCASGGGGTALIRGSHMEVLARVEASPSYKELNSWVVKEMRRRIEAGNIRIGQECIQMVGHAGDAVIMSPWLIHAGSTNLSGHTVRLMANCMVRRRAASVESPGVNNIERAAS